jgi:hypothetical protein
MNCSVCWRFLHKYNERIAGICECCQKMQENFDQRSSLDEMFVTPMGGEY